MKSRWELRSSLPVSLILTVACSTGPSSTPTSPPDPEPPPDTATVPPQNITGFTFQRDWMPGTPDPQGRATAGTELMRLTVHGDRLYAGTSVWRDPGLLAAAGHPGAQVLLKTGASAPWRVDASFGSRYLRVDALESVRFTRDGSGRSLEAPVDLLVAGLWDIGEGRDGQGRAITIATRDDATGDWAPLSLASVPESDQGFASVRAVALHRDQVTGADLLVVGAANGGIFTAVHDASAPAGLRTVGGDEVDPSYGRPQSFALCGGGLYASFDYGGLTVQGQAGGIFRRRDGPSPRWDLVYRNYDARYPTWNQTARGLTCVPGPGGPSQDVLLAALESVPEPVVIRLEIGSGHQAVSEINYRDLFAGVFGRPPGGDESGLLVAALNFMEPFTDPVTGQRGHFVTTNVRHPDDPAPGHTGAYYLLRRGPGSYDWGEVACPGRLRGVRTVVASPFPGEGDVYYFGGYTGSIVEPMQPNTAWICKGRWQPGSAGGGG